MLKSVMRRAVHPGHLRQAWVLHRGRKRGRKSKTEDDPQLKLLSQILPTGFLHYGYFEDVDRRPEEMSLAEVEGAQRRYADVIADEVLAGRPVLDVGCGMGGLEGVLLGRGFAADEVTALTPDAWQVKHVRETYPAVRTVHAKFEDLPLAEHAGRYGTVVTSESLQYLKLDKALPLMEGVLQPGGKWVACDYFRKDDEDGRATVPGALPGAGAGGEKKGKGDRSGHVWEAFRERLLAAGWRIEVERDVTANVLPTLRYIHMWATRFGLPLMEFGFEKLRYKHPGLHHLLSEALMGVDASVRRNVRVIDPEAFAARKRYMLLVMSRG